MSDQYFTLTNIREQTPVQILVRDGKLQCSCSETGTRKDVVFWNHVDKEYVSVKTYNGKIAAIGG